MLHGQMSPRQLQSNTLFIDYRDLKSKTKTKNFSNPGVDIALQPQVRFEFWQVEAGLQSN